MLPWRRSVALDHTSTIHALIYWGDPTEEARRGAHSSRRKSVPQAHHSSQWAVAASIASSWHLHNRFPSLSSNLATDPCIRVTGAVFRVEREGTQITRGIPAPHFHGGLKILIWFDTVIWGIRGLVMRQMIKAELRDLGLSLWRRKKKNVGEICFVSPLTHPLEENCTVDPWQCTWPQ